MLHANDGQFSGADKRDVPARVTHGAAHPHSGTPLSTSPGKLPKRSFLVRPAPPWAFASDRAKLARYAERLGLDDAAELRRDVHKRVECAFDDQRIWSAVSRVGRTRCFAAWPDDGTH